MNENLKKLLKSKHYSIMNADLIELLDKLDDIENSKSKVFEQEILDELSDKILSYLHINN